METPTERVVERWPVFAHQRKDALLRDNEPDLAAQVDDLSGLRGGNLLRSIGAR
jgi:hypothetical protein